ncbi:MAG: biotin--[acetyl-CoA-carboxylase] ligase [Rikenellaceae bacterium]|jgi:BirA family biotin operon repressor/biotin-[acetyl-CoA-carboxylase] ligase|nr:biotin--[acetyl-CoA-carboxylase] ligase [Rikenellaceae bacterium]
MIYYFDEIPSTIDEARYEKYRHGDVVVADHQTAGRGQRGHRWASPRGENLMFSAVLDTRFLLVTEQFLLLQTVALALTDMLAGYGLDARIKWTNDIYVGDRKITGVLIDHTIRDGRLARSGVGVGINVLQTAFEEWLPNPTSMKLEAGREFDRGEVLEQFMQCLTARYEMLRGGDREQILADYHSKIYRLGVPAEYELPDGGRFTGIIRGIKPSGDLIIENAGGTKCYLFREVQFVI